MDISTGSLAPYLLDRGLLDPRPVVAGELVVVETSRRHRSFQVRLDDGGFFVKQARARDPQAVATLEREGCCYYLAHHEPDFEALAEPAPASVDYDREKRLLVVDLVPGAETLSQVFQRREGLTEDTAYGLGKLVGTYHRRQGETRWDPRFEPLFPGMLPWPLQLDDLPMEHFQAFGPGAVEVLHQARRDPVLVSKSRALRAAWRKDCLIHGDLKWDNVLAYDDGGAEPSLKIVDWELADRGDALWDIAGLVQAHLLVWLWSMPLESGGDASRLAAGSTAPIEGQRPALRGLWRGYVEARGFDSAEAEEALGKTLALAAARLLQSAFERAVADGTAGVHALFLLRAARNVLEHPENARRHLGLQSSGFDPNPEDLDPEDLDPESEAAS